MNETLLAEDMKSTPKTAFVNKPYTQEERVKRDEEELEQLMKEQKGEAEAEPEEAEPTSAEEKTFKKRYSDLRRHQQKQAEDFKKEIDALKKQLGDATQKEMQLPKSDEDIEKWAQEYPDVAGIVETIAAKKAQEMFNKAETRLQELDEAHSEAQRVKAESDNTSDKLMIVLSDGQPSADLYRGSRGIEHTAKAVKFAESRGWSVIQVGFAGASEHYMSQMFTNHIYVNNVDTLGDNLSKIIRKVVKV